MIIHFSVARVSQMIAAGVEVNLLDSPENRNTPLHWAVTYGNKDVVECLCSMSFFILEDIQAYVFSHNLPNFCQPFL